MTQKEKTDRLSRAQALVDLVSKVEGGYRVKSSRDPNTSYFVSKPNGKIVCTCPDFEKHSQEDPSWQCKHIGSVILAHKLGKVNGSSSTPAPTPQSPVQDLEERPAETEIPVEEPDRLEPCMSCGVKLAVDELIPVQVPSGFGLVCRDCFGPPSRSCGYCGEEFTVDELTPIDTGCGPALACEICHEEVKAREAAEASSRNAPTLAFSIGRANAILASFGNAAIEKVTVKNRQGQVVKELFGYGLQYTLDAVNAALGPDAWSYKLLEWRANEEGKGALVLIELLLWDGARWHGHGLMFGATGLADEGDGLKGAIGDALKKSFAYWGIGSLAYRGELKAAKA